MPLEGFSSSSMKEGDRLRLLGITVTVPTDEQIAKARAKAGDDLPIRARLEFELEPLTYRLDGGQYTTERGYVDITKSKMGLTQQEIEDVRTRGILGVPAQKMLDMRVDTKRPVEKYNLPIQRFMWYAKKAGVSLLVSGTDKEVPATVSLGQVWSSAVGKVIVVKYGRDEFPSNNDGDTYGRWLYYFIALDPDFVALPENEREVRIIKPRDTEESAGEAVTATTSSGPTTEVLRAAALTAGIVGRNTADIGDENRQISLVNRAINNGAPVFGHPEVLAAAESGTLVAYLVDKGAVSVDADGTIA